MKHHPIFKQARDVPIGGHVMAYISDEWRRAKVLRSTGKNSFIVARADRVDARPLPRATWELRPCAALLLPPLPAKPKPLQKPTAPAPPVPKPTAPARKFPPVYLDLAAQCAALWGAS